MESGTGRKSGCRLKAESVHASSPDTRHPPVQTVVEHLPVHFRRSPARLQPVDRSNLEPGGGRGRGMTAGSLRPAEGKDII